MVPTEFLLQKNWKFRRSKFLWPWHGHCQHEIEWCMQNWKIAKLSVRSSWNSAIFVEQPSKRKVEFQWRTFVSWYLRPASQPSINNWPPISIARYMASSVLWMKYIDTAALVLVSFWDDDQTHLQNDVIYCIVYAVTYQKRHTIIAFFINTPTLKMWSICILDSQWDKSGDWKVILKWIARAGRNNDSSPEYRV